MYSGRYARQYATSAKNNSEMEKKIIIVGRIGNNDFENKDCCKVLSAKGVSKCIKTVTNYPPLIVRKSRFVSGFMIVERENTRATPSMHLLDAVRQ